MSSPAVNGRGESGGGEPRIVVLTAPSGSGKTSIARRLLTTIPDISFSVSATTRPPRPGEQDGVDYHFLTPEGFRSEVESGGLIEYEEVYPGRFYGTLRRTVDRATRAAPTLLDIDVVGAARVKELFRDEALTVFVMPPSMAILEQRLRGRGSETDDTLKARLDRAAMELSASDQFDVVVVNDHLETAVQETVAHVRSFLTGSKSGGSV